jgi:oligopeptidase B
MRIRTLCFIGVMMSSFISTAADLAAPQPPVAAKKPKDVTVHGDPRIDDYFWLREKTNPEVLAYLRAENAYADAMMAPQAALRETLYKEMLGRIKETDEALPYLKDGYWYSSKTEAGKQYVTYIRRKGMLSSPEQVLLDMNQLAAGKPFLSVGSMTVSPNGKLLAYALDETGGRDYTLYIKDIDANSALPDKILHISAAAWANDNRTLFYLTQNEAQRTNKLWRHTVGSAAKDALILEEKDELFDLDLGRLRSGAWLAVSSRSKDTAEVRLIDAAHPERGPKIVLPRKTGIEYSLDHRGKAFYLTINDTGRNFRLVKTAAHLPISKAWTEVIAHRKDVMIEDVDLFARYMVVRERDAGLLKLRVFDLTGPNAGKSHQIAFDEAVYSASGTQNMEFDTNTFRFVYTSLVTPDATYDYNLDTHERVLKKQREVLGGYDASKYATASVNARAPDGTVVPISLVYRKDLRRSTDGKGRPQPLLLNGYGSYGIPNDVYFSSNRVSLLDRGVIVAIAHIRGGGDLGRVWYDEGKLAKKMNTFTDFIACAQALMDQGYTSREQLIIEGGSAGGLLMGAVTNLRPDLFKAVVAHVPFVDVINTMLDETIPLTTGEFIEWGNPKIKEQYAWMRAYSPYDNLRAAAYPAIYVRTSLNDSQVAYWEPAKYVAKLRTLKTDKNPLIMSINLDAGHGGASGRYDKLKEAAQTYGFMLDQWGLAK